MQDAVKIMDWAKTQLLSNGYNLLQPPEDVQLTPWSLLLRFLTSDGYIYLKQMPKALSLEPAIIKILMERFQANVPIVIAENNELNCFLMCDAGISLREFFKRGFQLHLLCKALTIYTAIQYGASGHINLFIEMNVPDWRLKKLPSLYHELINQESLLHEDGLTINEIQLLHQCESIFYSLCEQLSQYKIPETLDHCDFHDNNILIEESTHHLTIIDLGETVITHPFFSLITCFRNAMLRYDLKEGDDNYLELQNTCFDSKLFAGEIKNNLVDAFSLAKKIWPIYATLGEYRLMKSSNPEEFKRLNRRGRLGRGLKEFIQVQTG